MTHDPLSRRRFVGTGAAALAAVWLAGAARPMAPGAAGVLPSAQLRDLDAISALILPSDDLPGAREARVVDFIDRALGSFAADQRPLFDLGLADLNARVARRHPGAGQLRGSGRGRGRAAAARARGGEVGVLRGRSGRDHHRLSGQPGVWRQRRQGGMEGAGVRGPFRLDRAVRLVRREPLTRPTRSPCSALPGSPASRSPGNRCRAPRSATRSGGSTVPA